MIYSYWVSHKLKVVKRIVKESMHVKRAQDQLTVGTAYRMCLDKLKFDGPGNRKQKCELCKCKILQKGVQASHSEWLILHMFTLTELLGTRLMYCLNNKQQQQQQQQQQQ